MQSGPERIVASWDFQGRGDPALLGSKASGLLSLPREWVPDFVVLTASFLDDWLESDSNFYAALSTSERAKVDHVVQQCASNTDLSSPAVVLVRSNAVEETAHGARGRYASEFVEPTERALAAAILRVRAAASLSMRIMLQVGVSGVNGHLSNERRVSSRRTTALIEGLPASPLSHPARMIGAAHAYSAEALTAVRVGDVEARLQQTLRFLVESRQSSVLVEWVWDGSRVWIVQADDAPEPRTDPSVLKYLNSKGVSSVPSRIALTGGPRHFSEVSTERWRKLRKASLFASNELPTADVYLWSGADWRTADAAQVLRELTRSADRYWVCRTDVAEGAPHAEDLLPTSDPTRDPDVLLDITNGVAADFAAAGLADEEWAFLLAPLIEARASAMVLAHPEGAHVQADAIWGFPDGLLYLPHDTYLGTEAGLLSRRIRYKPACLFFREGQWATVPLGSPLDHAEVLTEDEVTVLARWGLTVARAVGKPIQLMVLTRVDGVRGVNGMRAFHFTTDDVRPPEDSIGAPSAPATSFTVRNFDDVRFLTEHPDAAVDGVRLRPDESCRRNLDFLRDVGLASRDAGASIYFEGSLLGHAFHVMTETGATVIPIDVATIQGPRITHNKLVRDRIPTIVERSGSMARVRALDASTAQHVLLQKLVEEALEALSAVGEQVVEELADLREVLSAVEALLPDGVAQVQTAMERKRAERGGFDDLLFLEFTTPATIASGTAGTVPQHFDRVATAQTPELVTKVTRVEEGWAAAFDVPLISRGAGALRKAATQLSDAQVLEVRVEYSVTMARVSVAVRPPEVVGQTELF